MMPSHKDPLLCNASSLRKASRRISQFYDVILAPAGLKCSQHAILSHLDRLTEPNILDLAKALVLDRTALTHNLRPLMRDGFVALIPDEFDRRARRVQMTPLGKEKLAECKVLWAKAQKKFEKVYGEEQALALRIALAEIVSEDFLDKFENA
jgi:DNA-binding MarR family transcriptional regulator